MTLALLAIVVSFPGAEGFGAQTPGGRGGQTLFVTTLADSGPGSLRAAIDTPGPRTVLFRVAGLIDLASPLTVRHPFLTLAGESAPGLGVCLRGYPFVIATHDVIVRYLRVRLGDRHPVQGDAFSIATPSRNVIVDHVSASWSIDEALSPSGDIANITVQWSLIAESLWHSAHSKGAHGYGSLVRATGGVTLHHNLWAHHNGRNPRFGDNYGRGDAPTYDFRNNVIYNCGSYCTGMVDGRIRVNYINNYLKPGPNTKAKQLITLTAKAGPDTRFHLAGNQPAKLFDHPIEPAPFPAPPVQTHSAPQAYDLVLAHSGARRDPVDARIVADVQNATGKLIDSPDEVGGWPAYPSASAPLDADNDGLPDAWERTQGLNPNDPADARQLTPSGYTQLERYLHSLCPSPI